MTASQLLACGSAAISGWFLACAFSQARDADVRQRYLRETLRGRRIRAHADDTAEERPASPVLQAVCRQSQGAPSKHVQAIAGWRVWSLGLGDGVRLIAQAGLSDRATTEGVRAVRMGATLAGLAAGFLAGWVFTPELAIVLGLSGLVGGYCCVPFALRAQAAARNADMERHLSEMLEVVVLGLQSGLSFERSFALYPHYFNSELGRSMSRVASRWDMGLMSREEALRELEREYDSALLTRVVESMVRSLRFGTSIAKSLEASAVEARAVNRARLEEQVAKVAVKMMLPVGVLILPAMLLLVLGPVMLELVEGF